MDDVSSEREGESVEQPADFADDLDQLAVVEAELAAAEAELAASDGQLVLDDTGTNANTDSVA